MDLGPLAVANGVLYAPSMAQGPTASTMFGLDAATGNILWDFAAGGSVVAGATPVNNNLYWGSGYSHLGALGTGNNKFFGFTPNGK
jgi:polyvinyl alcohol dehydrogenase (cytochrome)